MSETDLKLIDYYDPLIKELDNRILALAKAHDPTSLYLLKSISGVGDILSLTMLYEIHDIGRFPSRGSFAPTHGWREDKNPRPANPMEPPALAFGQLYLL